MIAPGRPLAKRGGGAQAERGPGVAPVGDVRVELGGARQRAAGLQVAVTGDPQAIEGYGKGAIVGQAGEIEHGALWHAPGGPGVRVDSHVYNNYFVPPNYYSMIGKIIVHGDTREQALARMRTALSECVVEGIQTNIPLHRELMVDAKFIEGGTSIHYLEGWLAQHKR